MFLSKHQRILGALYGQALGDAMGMPSELWPRSRVLAHFGWIDRFLPGPTENNAACYFKQAEFTDDTSMALAIADAVIEAKGDIIPELIGQNILKWVERFDAFNKNVLGPSSKIALKAMIDGKSIESLENNSLTNGAAMRVSPLGCLLPTHNLNEFIKQIALASSPTHKSDVAIAGAVAIAWSISKAIDGVSWAQIKSNVTKVAQTAQESKVTTFSPSMAERISLALATVKANSSTKQNLEKIYQLVGAGTSTIESVAAAFAMVDLAKTDPNECAILSANLGGDTDTIGAMATSICGALNGFDSINPAWVKQLDEANHLDFEYYTKNLLDLREIKEKANDKIELNKTNTSA